jgi:DNA primase
VSPPPGFTPDWVKTFPVPRRDLSGTNIRYILINDRPTLVWLANLANLEACRTAELRFSVMASARPERPVLSNPQSLSRRNFFQA